MNEIEVISDKNVDLTARLNPDSTSDKSPNLTADESEDFVLELLRKQAGIDVLEKLIEIDPFKLSKPRRIDYLAALEKQTGWLQALMQNAIVAVAGEQPSEAESMWSGVDDAEREEVASALRLSPNTAQIRIDVARTLTNHLPSTCSALATGEISAAHATVIAKESAEIINRGAPKSVIKELEEAEELTKKNKTLTLNMCVNYGGRSEIVDAAAELARDVKRGKIKADAITEKVFAKYLDSPQMSDVDLFLRSSGEQRTSNFLPWQSVYAEFVFMDVLWPDVTRKTLWKAIEEYSSRDRRFGKA